MGGPTGHREPWCRVLPESSIRCDRLWSQLLHGAPCGSRSDGTPVGVWLRSGSWRWWWPPRWPCCSRGTSTLEQASTKATLPPPDTAPAPAPAPAVHGTILGNDGATPFASSSIWNQPLAADAALDPRSSELVAAFNQQWRTNYGTVGMNTDKWSIPIYRVPRDQPTVTVFGSDDPACNSDPPLRQQLAAVPIPANAHPANGTDKSLAIWQPSTDTVWEMWLVEKDSSGRWTSCWGGRITDVSTSNGVFDWPYGVAASGLSYLGGTVKVSELEAGEIKHALAVNVVHTAAGAQVGPANRNDGNSTDADAIPEGTRFRLDPSVDVDVLGLGRPATVIAHALQDYGMYVTDTAGAVVLMAEDGATYVADGHRDPYATLFAEGEPYEVLTRIPWDRLQVVAP